NAIHRCTESPQATGSGTNHANIPFNASLFHKCPSVQMLSWLPTRNVEEPRLFSSPFLRQGDITVLAIEPHPEDQERRAYQRIKLSAMPSAKKQAE
ncbi:MAG: hypothetical protein KGJ88_02095, partial [Verrucomicrobiota bacterium]|nr:hypothetical protein [Verrucomicrobiota bacterium]